ncbi:phospholipase D-like domain-containing protein, partial [Thiomicrospira sp.]|uniref:phospholipase D-like domain-containing protein n=1 Tax=Thiomicrospira sp. TaxID=935 RepID=UPI0025DF17D4
MLSDDPAKGLGQAKLHSLMSYQLEQIIGEPSHQVTLISPYFVPTKAGTQDFIDLVNRGVKIRILTNSLDATDVVAVHAGYAKHRRHLLAGGVELFEMRLSHKTNGKPKKNGPFGSSATSLHAKTFAVDSQHVFVGSFNFDPRSSHLNTELGFVIDSPKLAKTIEQSFEQ